MVKTPEGRRVSAEFEEVAVEVPQPGSDGVGPGPGEDGGVSSCGVAGVGNLTLPREGSEFLYPPLSDGLDQAGVVEVGEEGERGRLAIFLAHEEEGQARGEEEDSGRESDGRGRKAGAVAVRSGPVADLIVVLDESDEAI